MQNDSLVRLAVPHVGSFNALSTMCMKYFSLIKILGMSLSPHMVLLTKYCALSEINNFIILTGVLDRDIHH